MVKKLCALCVIFLLMLNVSIADAKRYRSSSSGWLVNTVASSVVGTSIFLAMTNAMADDPKLKDYKDIELPEGYFIVNEKQVQKIIDAECK